MRRNFSLFNSHLDLVKKYWSELVSTESIVIDATCGNGHDTHYLASLCPKKILSFDIQKEALQKAKELTGEKDGILFLQQSHANLEPFAAKGEVTLIVYNLGYLPGGNKNVTTKVDTTLASVKSALALLQKGGAICITCYPGHEEGKREEEALLSLCKELPPLAWNVCYSQFLNRNLSPSVLLLQASR